MPGDADHYPSLMSSASSTCSTVKASELDLGEALQIHHPVHFWVELHNPTPMDAFATTIVQNFGIQNEFVEQTSGYNPPLGIHSAKMNGIIKTAGSSSSLKLPMEQRENEKRLFFGKSLKIVVVKHDALKIGQSVLGMPIFRN